MARNKRGLHQDQRTTLAAIKSAGADGFENRDFAHAGTYHYPRQRMEALVRRGLVAEVVPAPNAIARYVLTVEGAALVDREEAS